MYLILQDNLNELLLKNDISPSLYASYLLSVTLTEDK